MGTPSLRATQLVQFIIIKKERKGTGGKEGRSRDRSRTDERTVGDHGKTERQHEERTGTVDKGREEENARACKQIGLQGRDCAIIKRILTVHRVQRYRRGLPF